MSIGCDNVMWDMIMSMGKENLLVYCRNSELHDPTES